MPSLLPVKLSSRLRTKSTPGDLQPSDDVAASRTNPNSEATLPTELLAALGKDRPASDQAALRRSISDDARPRPMAAAGLPASVLPAIAAYSPMMWPSESPTASPRMAQLASRAMQQGLAPATPEVIPPTPQQPASPRLTRSPSSPGGRASPRHSRSRAIPTGSADASPDPMRVLRKAASVESIARPSPSSSSGFGLGLGMPFDANSHETISDEAKTPSPAGARSRTASATTPSDAVKAVWRSLTSPDKGKGKAIEADAAPTETGRRSGSMSRSRANSGSAQAAKRDVLAASASSADDTVPPLPTSPSHTSLKRLGKSSRPASMLLDDQDRLSSTSMIWPRSETFTHDLARARRFKPQLSQQLTGSTVEDAEDDLSASDSEGEFATDYGEFIESDHDESHTANISHGIDSPAESPTTRLRSTKIRRPPLSRSSSADDQGMLVLPDADANSMRLRMALRERPAGERNAAMSLPPDLVLASTLSRTPSESGVPRTAPLPDPTMRHRVGSESPAPPSADDDLAARGRSFSDSAISDAAAPNASDRATNPALTRSMLSREITQATDAALSSVTGIAASSRPETSDSTRSSQGSRPRSGSLLKDVNQQALSRKSGADYTLALVGARGVGKSTIVQRGLKHGYTTQVMASDGQQNAVTLYTSKLSSTGAVRSLQVLEVDSALLKDDGGGIVWPKYLPAVDGVLVCYDATQPNGQKALHDTLDAFWRRGMTKHLIIIGNKVSQDETANHVKSPEAARLANFYGAGTVLFDGAPADKAKYPRTFQWLICEIDTARNGGRPPDSPERSRPPSRRSKAQPDAAAPAKAPTAVESSFIDMTRESIDSQRAQMAVDDDLTIALPPLGRVSSAVSQPSPQSATLPSSERRESDASYMSGQSAGYSHAPTSATGTEPMSPVTSLATVSDATSLSHTRTSTSTRAPELDTFFTREDIIDKFLFASVSANGARRCPAQVSEIYADDAFVTMFTIVFRRFARPYEVLTKVLERYEFISSRLTTDAVLARYAHMRLCATLTSWVESYPGDFTAPMTQQMLRQFVESIVLSPWVSHYTVELLRLLGEVAQARDLDAGWALPDTGADAGVFELPRKMSSVPSLASTSPDTNRNSRSSLGDSVVVNLSGTPLTQSVASFESGGPSPSLASSSERHGDTLTNITVPSSRPRGASDAAQSDTPSATSRKSSRATSLLDTSTALIEADEALVALSITKQSWDIFSEIDPRDLIRHVLAPRDAKYPSGAPIRDPNSPVARSIALVNHLSNWTATMILVQPRTRMRARAYDRLIGIAVKLRKAECFDALMGVLAGLNSQPVYRLETTFEPLTEGRRKQFGSLNRLMSTAKSFNAYRMALSTASAQHIPYLGCHLQDITRISEGKSDMRNGLVNLSKLQQIARAASVVVDCPRNAPLIPTSPAIERLHVDVPVLSLESEELYNRSYAIKPRDTVAASSTPGGAPRSSGGGGGRSKLRKLLEQVRDAGMAGEPVPPMR